MEDRKNYTSPRAQEIAFSCGDILYDSNEGGWAPVNVEEEE